MSQVISIRVPEHYEEACVTFQKKIAPANANGRNESAGQIFMVSYDKSTYEIQCEGDFPDSVFSALLIVKDQFGGKLFYEGEEWNENDGKIVEEAGSLTKLWIVLAIIFFPITLIYLLIRVFVWVPFKVWNTTR